MLCTYICRGRWKKRSADTKWAAPVQHAWPRAASPQRAAFCSSPSNKSLWWPATAAQDLFISSLHLRTEGERRVSEEIYSPPTFTSDRVVFAHLKAHLPWYVSFQRCRAQSVIWVGAGNKVSRYRLSRRLKNYSLNNALPRRAHSTLSCLAIGGDK